MVAEKRPKKPDNKNIGKLAFEMKCKWLDYRTDGPATVSQAIIQIWLAGQGYLFPIVFSFLLLM